METIDDGTALPNIYQVDSDLSKDHLLDKSTIATNDASVIIKLEITMINHEIIMNHQITIMK